MLKGINLQQLLFTGCARLGALEQGEWIHRYIEYNRIKTDADVGTAVIEMYAKCGSIDKSLDCNHLLKVSKLGHRSNCVLDIIDFRIHDTYDCAFVKSDDVMDF
ncbi:hypothetical protein COP1_017777 [Malus domestica]